MPTNGRRIGGCNYQKKRTSTGQIDEKDYLLLLVSINHCIDTTVGNKFNFMKSYGNVELAVKFAVHRGAAEPNSRALLQALLHRLPNTQLTSVSTLWGFLQQLGSRDI